VLPIIFIDSTKSWGNPISFAGIDVAGSKVAGGKILLNYIPFLYAADVALESLP
jgi:hypothetical protein